jgi:parallel beta-helix repeat protein
MSVSHAAKMLRNFASVIVLVWVCQFATGQPSGGPYGPIQQSYELPKVSGKIYYVAPDGKAESAGDQLNQPTTIEFAIANVKTGDAIILRGGIYRTGDLQFNQGITIQPYANEQPIFKGSQVATEWKRLGRGGLWKTSWKTLFQAYPDDWWTRDRYGKTTPLHLFNNDMVFVDGKILNSAGWEGEVDENSFYVDYKSGTIYIGQDPENHEIEITAFNRGLQRVTKDVHGKQNDHKGVMLRGIVFTHYAYCAFEIDGYEPQALADPSTFGKDVVGSVIEHCTFSYCGRVGTYLRGDNTVLRNCDVHHTTTEGVYLLSSSDCLLERNKFSQNNIEELDGYYPAAVKIFDQTYRVTCRDNLVYDLPVSNGIWYDVGNVDGRFINNHVMNVGTNKGKFGNPNIMWTNYNGMFFEISKQVTAVGNVFEHCDQGIFILNSSDAHIYQNTFVNSTVCIGRDLRSAQGDHFGWHPSTGPDVDERFGHIIVNNLLAGDINFVKPFIVVYQHKDLCDKLKESPLKQFDYNVYVKDMNSGYKGLMMFSPVEKKQDGNCSTTAETLDDLKGLFTGSSLNSRVYEGFNMPLFKSLELGNYELNSTFPGANAAVIMPANIQKLLGITAKVKPYIGAYPVK